MSQFWSLGWRSVRNSLIATSELKTLTWLSCRDADTNSSLRPKRLPGCASTNIRSKSVTFSSAVPRLVAMKLRSELSLGSFWKMVEARMGRRSVSLSIRSTLGSDCRWMHSVEILPIVFSLLNRRRWVLPPVLTETRPASLRSRSYHVCHRPPP